LPWTGYRLTRTVLDNGFREYMRIQPRSMIMNSLIEQSEVSATWLLPTIPGEAFFDLLKQGRSSERDENFG